MNVTVPDTPLEPVRTTTASCFAANTATEPARRPARARCGMRTADLANAADCATHSTILYVCVRRGGSRGAEVEEDSHRTPRALPPQSSKRAAALTPRQLCYCYSVGLCSRRKASMVT